VGPGREELPRGRVPLCPGPVEPPLTDESANVRAVRKKVSGVIGESIYA
jgi:hypothetical protein